MLAPMNDSESTDVALIGAGIMSATLGTLLRKVTSADGSLAALLGASPGASTAVSIMLELLARCFPERWASPIWRARLAALFPSTGAA